MLDGSELPGRPSMVDDRHVEAQMHGWANAKKQSKKKRQVVEKEGKQLEQKVQRSLKEVGQPRCVWLHKGTASHLAIGAPTVCT